MKKIFVFTFLLTGCQLIFAQMDTVYTVKEKLVGTVTAIGASDIKFVYPNEDAVNSISQSLIRKIVFKSGRVQEFASASMFKPVASADDWENVTITQVDSEVHGLYKLGDVGSKAKGTTQLSNQERVKQRAIRKLKIETAMMGGNIVYITSQRTQGNQGGYRLGSGESAETNITGVAYSNTLPDYAKFTALAGDKKNFLVWSQTKLYSSGSDMSYQDLGYEMKLDKIYKEGEFIMVNANISKVDSKKFRITYFDQEYFTLEYRDKKSLYNLYVYWEN